MNVVDELRMKKIRLLIHFCGTLRSPDKSPGGLKPVPWSPGVQRKHTVTQLLQQLLGANCFTVLQSRLLVTAWWNTLPPWWSDMGLHALLQGPCEVRVLRGWLGIVGGGGGRCLAVFVELHIAVRLTVAADAAVTLCVDEGAGVAERAALELPLAELNGAAAHAQHKALAVVVQAVGTCSQGGIDVGEGHASRYSLLAQGTCVGGVPNFCGLIPCHGRRVVLLEGINAVVAVCWVLYKTQERQTIIIYI